jgi:hypothetical protein
MAQQTAVEWFYNSLIVYMNGDGDFESAQQIYKQAKEMEKEHIIKSSRISYLAGQEYYTLNGLSKQFAEEYYNETYKK